jgi:uncharacterized protein YggE
MSDRNSRSQKAILLAGILVAGVAAVLIANQMQNATAQTAAGGNQTIAAVTNAPASTNATSSGRSTLSTSGTATTSVQPDKFTVMAGVETNSTTAQGAAAANAKAMDGVIAALRKLGVHDNQTSTSNYSLYPIYEARPTGKVCPDIYPPPPGCQPGQVITGYRASNILSVTLDVNGTISAGSVIDAAVGAGANNVNGVSFFLSQAKQQEIRDGLIQQAVANARHRADIGASAAGMQVTGIQSMSLNDVQFPVFARALGAAPAASTQIMPGEQDVTTTVSITFYIGSAAAAGG